MYRLAVVGDSQAQLNDTTLREWLKRAGFNVWSGWGNPNQEEDVWFGLATSSIPTGVPCLSLGQTACRTLTGYTLPIQKVRGALLPMKEGGWLVATLDPADVGPSKGQDHLKPHLGGDARRACESSRPQIPQVSFLQRPSELEGNRLRPVSGDIVSVDIEGANGRPNIVGVSWDEAQAYVFPWSEELREWLNDLFASDVMVVGHNMSYDIPELEEAGVTPPRVWYDTIVMAALYDPSQLMGLQPQVLTHVPGSVAWKGLINHEKGPDFTSGAVQTYRTLWTEILRCLAQPIPPTGAGWYRFYNNLDSAWGLALANNLKRKLTAQGRWNYYTEVLMPLQAPLLKMGQEGMPLDLDKLKEHQESCQWWKEEARNTIMSVGQGVFDTKRAALDTRIRVLVSERAAEGGRKFSKAAELTKLRQVIKAEEFNPDSPQQLATLLYEHYGLPVIKTPKGKGSVAENSIEQLKSRVERGTAKVKGDKDEALKVLIAITAYNHWGHWIDTFLNPPVEHRASGSALLTAYSLHRTQTGRLSSGLDTSDLDKSTKKVRKQQVQNIPKELRDMVAAPEGYTFVSGDYSGIEWAIAMWYVAKEYDDGYHLDMLDRFYRGEFDPHTFLADKAGCDRQTAKVFTHGYTYDGSPRTLARNAGLNDATGVAVCAAHDLAFRTRNWKEAVVARAKRDHKIQTPLGWRCYTWAWQPKPQEILAWLVQGTAADLCKWVMKDIFKGLPLEGSRMVTSTHDSFLLQVPEQLETEAVYRLKKWMQQPIPWLDNRQWRADVRVGKTWRDVS